MAVNSFVCFLIFLYSNGNCKQLKSVGYTATVYVDTKPTCSGAFISKMFTITTCLCVSENIPPRVTVRIGDPENNPKSYFSEIDRIEMHPQCIDDDSIYHCENDIALLKLVVPFPDSKNIWLIKLPRQLVFWMPDIDKTLELSVYTDQNNKAPSLEKAIWHTQVKLLPYTKCVDKIRQRVYKAGYNMCSDYNHVKGNCSWDLGAPLGYHLYLIGLIIHKPDGCEGVVSYVNVAMHSLWIRDVTHKYVPWVYL